MDFNAGVTSIGIHRMLIVYGPNSLCAIRDDDTDANDDNNVILQIRKTQIRLMKMIRKIPKHEQTICVLLNAL